MNGTQPTVGLIRLIKRAARNRILNWNKKNKINSQKHNKYPSSDIHVHHLINWISLSDYKCEYKINKKWEKEDGHTLETGSGTV